MGGMAWAASKPFVEPAERLTGQDTMLTAITKIAGGNPGALRVCTEIVKWGTEIDPNGLPFGTLLILDSLHIYGYRVWLLYKDICQENLITTMACLRGWQLGIVNQKDLIKAIDNAESGNRAHSLDLPLILVAVRERLGNFGNITETKPPVPTTTLPPEQPEPPKPSPDPEINRIINLD
ncbi:MAG: hypothetical protein WC919_01400 [Candidatus Paceibacterota bacterium]